MGRQQMVDSYFWEDPWVQKLADEERYLFLYLLTNPHTNLAGIYEITDDTIEHHTKLDKAEQIPRILEKFQKDGKVYRWGDYIVMRNWPKRQAIGNPKIQIGIERILDTLPVELLEFLVLIDYKYPKTRAVLNLKKEILAEKEKRELSTDNAQDTVSIPEEPQEITYPYGNDRLSHSTSLHSTSLHSTEPEPRPLQKPLSRLLAGIRGVPE